MMSTVLLVTATTKSKGGSSGLILIVGAVALIAVMLLSRRRAAARLAVTPSTYAVGDEIITRQGIIATIVTLTDVEATLEIAPGVHMRVVPGAIAQIYQPVDTGTASDPDDDDRPAEDRADWPTRSDSAAPDGAEAGSTEDTSAHAGDTGPARGVAGSPPDGADAPAGTAPGEDAPGEDPPQPV